MEFIRSSVLGQKYGCAVLQLFHRDTVALGLWAGDELDQHAPDALQSQLATCLEQIEKRQAPKPKFHPAFRLL